MSSNLIAVYYNNGKLNLFRISLDVTLSDLNDQLDKINVCLNHDERRRMVNVDYYCSPIDSERFV